MAHTPGNYTVVGRSLNLNGGTTVCPALSTAEVSNGGATTLDAYCSLR